MLSWLSGSPRNFRRYGRCLSSRAFPIAPIYGWFTDGFDTLDLKEAKAFLGELAV